MRQRIEFAAGATTVFAALLAVVGRGAAHSGHTEHASGPDVALVAAIIVGSLLVLGTSVYLDHAGELDGLWADVGVLVGVVGLLAGIALTVI